MIAVGVVMVITSILAEVAVYSTSRCLLLLVVCFAVYVATVIGCVVMIAWFATLRDTVKQSTGDLIATCVNDYVGERLVEVSVCGYTRYDTKCIPMLRCAFDARCRRLPRAEYGEYRVGRAERQAGHARHSGIVRFRMKNDRRETCTSV
jgi:hypothetical protein